MWDKPEICSAELAKYVCWVKRGLFFGKYSSWHHNSNHFFHAWFPFGYRKNMRCLILWTSGEAVSVQARLLSCLLILWSINPHSLMSRALPRTDNERVEKSQKRLKWTKGNHTKPTGNWVPTPSRMGKKQDFYFDWQQDLYPTTMAYLIPLGLWSFIVVIPEVQRAAAFKEQPKSSECCVVVQKRCGLRVIKGSLRTTTKRWPHRTYRTSKRAGGKKKRPNRAFKVMEY